MAVATGRAAGVGWGLPRRGRSVAHAEVRHGSLLQADALEQAVARAALGTLAGDADPYPGGIIVLVEPHHVPFFLVERVVAGQRAGVGRQFEVDGRGCDLLVVVVVRSALRADRHDAVVAPLVLFEAEFLPEAVVGIDQEVGGVVQSFGREFGRHLGGERERPGVVHFGEQGGKGVVREFPVVGVAEEVAAFRAAEQERAVVHDADARVAAVEGMAEGESADVHPAFAEARGLRCIVGRGGLLRGGFRGLFIGFRPATLQGEADAGKSQQNHVFSHFLIV